MRLFIAADLPEDAREAIAAEQKRIASTLGGSAGTLKWVKADHAHLTLVFLGNVEEARVPAVVEAVGRDVDAAPFEISLETIGAFPARGAPRVLWIGVVDGAARLSELQRELAERIAAIGIPLEDRPFHPHLTLARWRESRPADRERALAAAPLGAVARACVDGATLYAGPSYTALARATLTGRPTNLGRRQT